MTRNEAEMLIQTERRRQIEVERFPPERDIRYSDGELMKAAEIFLWHDTEKAGGFDHGKGVPIGWPWDAKWWKPRDRRRNLERAGALMLAEKDRYLYEQLKPVRISLSNPVFPTVNLDTGHIDHQIEIVVRELMKETGSEPPLEACPLCNAQVEFPPMIMGGVRDWWFSIQCMECSCQVDSKVVDSERQAWDIARPDVIRKWNFRPGRDARQAKLFAFCVKAFTQEQSMSLPQRGIRHFEEATETAQAAGTPREMCHKMVDHVFDRPVGELKQEIGGSGVTLLALATAAGLSADQCEADELVRVLAKPIEHFQARNRQKNEAGFLAVKS